MTFSIHHKFAQLGSSQSLEVHSRSLLRFVVTSIEQFFQGWLENVVIEFTRRLDEQPTFVVILLQLQTCGKRTFFSLLNDLRDPLMVKVK